MDDERGALKTGDVIERTDATAIERGATNPETGEFSAVLATEGEASDGHILSIRGLTVEDQMPLLAEHDPGSLMGSVHAPKKSYGVMPTLRVRPRVELEGPGRQGDVRRDAFHMIQKGHLRGMSIRWDTVEATRRVNLPRDHRAFVDASKLPDGDPRRWGSFISKAVAREGSLVVLGADSEAKIGRSDSVALTYFRMLRNQAKSDGRQQVSAALGELNEKLDALRSLGVSEEDLAELLSGGTPIESHAYRYLDEGGSLRTAQIPRAAWETIQGESLRAMDLLAELQDEARASIDQARTEAKAPREEHVARPQVMTRAQADEIKASAMRAAMHSQALAVRQELQRRR